MMPIVKVCLKTDYIKHDGTVNIRIRITHRKTVKYFPLGIYIKPAHFIDNRISKKDPYHWMKNMALNKFYEKAMKIIFDMELAGQPFTFDKFSNHFLDDDYGKQLFKAFADKYIESNKGTVTLSTTKIYKSQLNKINEFAPGLIFENITLPFIRDFERFLSVDKKNNANTRLKTLKIIKAILNHAKAEGVIRDHNLVKFHIGSIQGNREFLTREELQQLEILYQSGSLDPKLKNVLTYFLFGCYTGLRYQDIRNLRNSNIHNDQAISLQMNKTGKTVRVPLTDKARTLIPEQLFKNKKTFRVLSNQPTNRYLKDIMGLAGINKNISFHCARHTFATVSLDLGISMETVKEILGHTDYKTTAIYGRIRDGKKKQEMDKWNSS
jgi:integrase